MTQIWEELMETFGRHHPSRPPPRRHHHPHPHPHAPPFPVRRRSLTLHIHYRRNHQMSTVSLTWDLPVARTDGSALSPDEISSIDVFDTTSATPDVPIG